MIASFSALSEWISQSGLIHLSPELLLLVLLVFTLVQTVLPSGRDPRSAWQISILGLGFVLLALVLQLFLLLQQGVVPVGWLKASGVSMALPTVFWGTVQADLFAWFLRFFLVLGTLLVTFLSRPYMDKRASSLPGEFYALMQGALLGAMFMAGANDLILLFVGLETLGISSYIMAGYLRGNVRSGEAGLKYLLYGGVSSAVLLYGLSLLYGISGGYTQLPDIVQHLPMQWQQYSLLFPVIFTMIFGALGFKLSVVPFHMWTPDVYEGAPTPLTAFLSVVSKMAGFAVLVRILTAFSAFSGSWLWVLATIAVLSMVVGNVAALGQRNVKRLLAYSTIAHAGYMMLGALTLSASGSQDGLAALLYYLVAYLFMNIGAFASVVMIATELQSENIDDWAGLVRKRPGLVMALSVFLLSLAGMPITSGFFAKFFLFQAVAASSPVLLGLVVVALLASTVSLYYYLNLIRLMVVAPPSGDIQRLPVVEGMFRPFQPALVAVNLCVFMTLLLGFAADGALHWSRFAVTQMMHAPYLNGLLGQASVVSQPYLIEQHGQ